MKWDISRNSDPRPPTAEESTKECVKICMVVSLSTNLVSNSISKLCFNVHTTIHLCFKSNVLQT